MVVIDGGRGRTATYYPPTRRWEEHQRIPGRSVAHALWTGDEVIVFGSRAGPDSDSVDWYAFDPARGRWRDVAPSPPDRYGGSMAWTGDLLLVVGGDRTAAAYDPAADCWLEMPEAPLPELQENERTLRVAEWGVASTHWTGTELLAVVVGPWPRHPTGTATFDLGSWTWTPGSIGPVAGDMVDPVFADGRLWFMSEDPNDRHVTNATYDPITDTWVAHETGCPVNTRWATWTGRLIMEPYSDRRAFDPSTGQCFRTPPSKDRARQWEPVWTGREFIYWSGAYGDTSHARPDGIVYRPPRSAVTAERVEPIGKKLARAISSRRRAGLDTDLDIVREIMQDPYQPASEQFGFPMSEDDFWDINSRSHFSHQLHAELVDHVKSRRIHGGTWIDQRAGGALVIALTEEDPRIIAKIDELVPKDPDLGWRLVIVPMTRKELNRAFNRAWKVSKEVDPTAMLWSVGRDDMNGRIEMMYDPDDVKRMRARKDELEKELGVPVRITSGRVRDV